MADLPGGEDVFVFAIPLVPKRRAKHWDTVIANLQATLQSILNQTDKNFHCFIAAEDPVFLKEIDSPHVTLIKVPDRNGLESANSDYAKSHRNIWHKRSIMTAAAIEIDAKYVMFTDADDLVSNRLVDYIRTIKPEFGAAIRYGFVFDPKNGKCLPVPSEHVPVKSFDGYCGTSIVLTSRQATEEQSNAFSALCTQPHHRIRETAAEYGMPLLDVLEMMAVYVLNTGENISVMPSNDEGRLKFARTVITNIENYGRPMSKAQLKEFGLWS
jgi:glycosyltransferase involved in cell wall biosynthesis